ncbi:MAG: calcium/proton exchanger [Candidatus Dormibacteria bacterium]
MLTAAFAWLASPGWLIFLGACLGLVFWSALLGTATEELALTLGGAAAAVINVTFANATELIVTLFALAAGLLTVVQASLVGSVLGNVLLLFGLSLVAGGMRHPNARFDRRPAGIATMLLVLATATLVVVSVFASGYHPGTGLANPVMRLSLTVAPVLLVIYVLSVIHLVRRDRSQRTHAPVPGEKRGWSRRRSVTTMVVTAVGIAILSDLLVGSIQPTVKQLGVGQAFIGLVIVPLVGNVAENMVAVRFAWLGDLDLSLGISMGSSLQVALFLAPVLVILSLFFGHPMTLAFPALEVAALLVAVLGVSVLVSDGETNWVEGAALVGLYLVMAAAFLFS